MSIASHFDVMSYAPSREDDTAARAWLSANDHAFGHFIDGQWVRPEGTETFASVEPATGRQLATLSVGGRTEVDTAVEAARAAQAGWSSLDGHERARKLYALARLIQRDSRLIAVLESLDNGKPIRESRDIDIPLAARHFYHHAGWAQLQRSCFRDYRPIGVVGQIIPWNFPFLMLAWKVAPALALGNTVVLKPAEDTSLTALLMADLARSAELPDGVFNVVTGAGDTGSLIVEHSGIDKIAFTGSTQVGKRIRRVTAGTGKSLTLELGGKSPFIVFDDADLDSAVEGVVDAIWFNQGQVCCAGSRLLLQEGVAADFLTRLRRRMNTLRVGLPLDKTIDMGAIVSPAQRERISTLVEQAVSDGATLFQGECDLPGTGSFYPPTLLSDVEPSHRVADEEIFGPVLVSMTFRTFDEAIEMANHTRYGLSATVWSESIGQSLEVASELHTGIVWINSTNLMDAAVGFGGRKESGFGREGGREGCFEYLRPCAWDQAVPRGTTAAPTPSTAVFAGPSIDRTYKHFIGGKQARPDQGRVRPVGDADGNVIGTVGEGNRKDLRNAVEAARSAGAWTRMTAHARAQVLFYLAENLASRADAFVQRLQQTCGVTPPAAQKEVRATLSRLFTYAAWADKFDGQVHRPPLRGTALAIPEPLGVVGVVCPPEAPLLAFVSLVAPLLAVGNRVVVVPSEPYPLTAIDFCSVVESSDVPGGVLNVVSGDTSSLASTLAEHDGVDAIWSFGSSELSTKVEHLSAGNLKRTFVDDGRQIDWHDAGQSEGEVFLRHATDVKNIWIPYGA